MTVMLVVTMMMVLPVILIVLVFGVRCGRLQTESRRTKQHGGRIECTLEVEKGAEFRVVLPAVELKLVAPEFAEVSLDAA